MKNWILVGLFSVASLQAQTTLRLRYGGYGSTYRITAVSSATPAVLTVVDQNQVPGHSLVAGDLIYLHDGSGCRSLWGFKKVASSPAPTATTFAVTETNGTAVTCATPFDTTLQSGWVGKYHTVTANPSPRMVAPQSGAIHDRVIDSRPSGGAASGMSTENGKAWQVLLSGTASLVTASGCDGQTDALCPKELAGLGNAGIQDGTYIQAIATVYIGDKTKTNYLNATKYYLYTLNRSVYSYGRKFGFPVDDTAPSGGLGSSTDWIHQTLGYVAAAYDMVRNDMTAPERQRFADMMLNGWDGDAKTCTNQSVKQSGTVNVSGLTVTGTGLDAIYSVGDYFMLKDHPDRTHAPTWGQVATVSSTSMTYTLAGNSTVAPTATGIDHYKISLWDQASNHCGALWAGTSAEENIGQTGRQFLTSTQDNVTTTLVLDGTENILDTPPYYLYVGTEVELVTSVVGNTLTVVRGQQYSTAAAHTDLTIPAVWVMHPRGVVNKQSGYSFMPGAYGYNVQIARQVGHISLGIALLGDDSRAVTLLEKVFNLWYDLTYPLEEEMMSGETSGGIDNYGYQWGRYNANFMHVYLGAIWGFDYSYSELLGDYFWRGSTLPFWQAQPGGEFTQGPESPWYSATQYETLVNSTNLAWLYAAAMLHPSAESNYASYWLRNYSNMRNGMGIRVATYAAPYFVDTNLGTDWKTVLDPWKFYFTPSGRGNDMLVSRSDWSTSAALVMCQAFYSRLDHNDQGMGRVPGALWAHKGSKLLIGGNASRLIGATETTSSMMWMASGSSISRNTGQGLWWTTGEGESQAGLDRKFGSTSYVYARVRLAHFWAAVINATRSTRSFIHVKGTDDYVVVFDDHAASHTNTITANWWYPFQDDIEYIKGVQGISTRSGCPAPTVPTFNWDSGNALVTYKKPDTSCNPITGYRKTAGTQPPVIPAMVSTKVLFPDGQTPTITTVDTTYSHSIHIAWGSQAAAQMITIHKLATGTSDTMPVTALITADTDSVAAQIDNGNRSWAFVYSKDGADRYIRSVTTTYSGSGQAIFTGLAPGDYTTTIDGGVPSGATTVFADGTLKIVANGAHTFVVRNTSTPALELSASTLIFDCTPSANPSAQTVGVIIAGGVLDNWSATKSLSWLTLSPASGSVAGNFDASVDCSAQTEGTYTDTISVSSTTIGVTNSPQTIAVTINVTGEAPPTSVTITTTIIPDAVFLASYSTTLAATGGSAPYTWAITSGSLPDGLTLSTDGVLSGVTSQAGVFNFGVTATDSNSEASPEKSLTLSIPTPITSVSYMGLGKYHGKGK